MAEREKLRPRPPVCIAAVPSGLGGSRRGDKAAVIDMFVRATRLGYGYGWVHRWVSGCEVLAVYTGWPDFGVSNSS